MSNLIKKREQQYTLQETERKKNNVVNKIGDRLKLCYKKKDCIAQPVIFAQPQVCLIVL